MQASRKKWLVVTYFANEGGMACSHHIDDRLPLLRERGIDVTLLTTLIVPKNPSVRHLRTPTLSPSGIRFEVRQYFKRKHLPKWQFELIVTLLLLPVLPFYLLERALFRIDTTWYWTPLAALRGYLLCRRNRPDLIYSTGGPACAHIAAGWIAGRTGIPWVAELQDPLVHSYCGRSAAELRIVYRAERYICGNADRVIFLTGEAARRAASRTDLDDRGVCIYPGASSFHGAPQPWERRETMRFAHFGTLSGVRNLASFIRGLEEAVAHHPHLQETVEVHLFGNAEKDVRRQIEESPCRGMFMLHGLVPRDRVVAEMRGSDVLLLVQGVDDVSAETIPSKAYEYFHARRPVLGLVYKNPELRGVLENLGHVAVEADKRKEIRDGLLHFVERWRSGALAEPAGGSHFTVERAVERLIALASEAGEAHTEGEGG